MAVFYGYPGQVWANVYGALNIFNNALSFTSTPFTVLPLAEAVLQTALNGLNALTANRLANSWQGTSVSMANISSLPLTLSPTDVTYFQNRLNSFTAAASGIIPCVPLIPMTGVAAALSAGNPSISASLDILTFFQSFNVEPAPSGLVNTNLPVYAAQSTQAFYDISGAINTLPNGDTYLLDIAQHIGGTNSEFTDFVGEFYQFLSPTPQMLWNQMFVLPTLLMFADWATSAPNTLAAQQDMLIRYLIITIINQLNQFIMTASRPVNAPSPQVPVFVNDSLMDIAARGLGNYEQWTQIATLNNLQPPYIARNASQASGIAGWGGSLALPVPGSTPVSGVAPNYLTNFLGVDLYFGPLNGAMPQWTGDFQVIGGYNNLRWALGRRLQTTYGTLIYHSDYGSKIPPEIGQVQTAQTASYIAAFGRSALASDPRVASVPTATATLVSAGTIQFNGAVIPNGFGSTPVSVNEVITTNI